MLGWHFLQGRVWEHEITWGSVNQRLHIAIQTQALNEKAQSHVPAQLEELRLLPGLQQAPVTAPDSPLLCTLCVLSDLRAFSTHFAPV